MNVGLSLVTVLLSSLLLLSSLTLITVGSSQYGGVPHLCGSSVRNHVSVDGLVDLGFCLESNETGYDVFLSYVNGLGEQVNVSMFLNRSYLVSYRYMKPGGRWVNFTAYKQWLVARNLKPPLKNPKLIIHYQGMTYIMPVGSYLPQTTTTAIEIRTKTYGMTLPAIITAFSLATVATVLATRNLRK